jgi:hypothetical protein
MIYKIVLTQKIALRRSLSLLPLKPRSRVRQRQTSALSPGCISNRQLHTQWPHQDHNSIMSNSKPQADSQSTPKWQSVSRQKKDQQFARTPAEWRLPASPLPSVNNYLNIPRGCGLLTGRELEITENYDATALAKAIRERELTCLEVTTAFCKVHHV